MIAELIVNECSSILAHVKTNQCTHCDVISCAFCHARSYPVATQKGVDDLCLYQSQCTRKCMCVLVLRFSRHLAIDSYMYNNKAVCARNKQDNYDDDKMNTLAFVKFPNSYSSKISTVKILRHTVCMTIQVC